MEQARSVALWPASSESKQRITDETLLRRRRACWEVKAVPRGATAYAMPAAWKERASI